ncbi:MAG: TonB-dependent receptor [Acidobacteria bacterium]|nr:TonB-dependent receptor [Acidobacteriota bacterium]
MLLSVLLCAGTALAQLPTATILGVVKDSTGAVIPNASLSARNVETALTRTAVSGADGSYRFVALPVGNYEVRVEASGFQTQVRGGLVLAVGQEAVINFISEVGTVEQAIEVTAEAPLVNTTSGSLGGLVDEQRVAELPLNGRNFIDLTLLQTGVQQHKNLSSVAGFTGTWFSSNGAPLRSNSFLLDGAPMQNIYGGSSSSVSNSTLGVEGIREYRVVTNYFSAENGMTMGSQMTIVSKSGTNDFHGSLFEYLRNSALDARNFFDRTTATNTRRLPAFTRNNFGGSAGGPIKKDKTFFFVTYEGLRERLGRTLVTNVIDPRNKVDGGLVPQISPITRPLLTLYPDPNLPNNQFTFPFSQPTNEHYGQARGDYTISGSDTLFGRYTIHDVEQIKPLDFPQFTSAGVSRSQYSTLSENHVFSPVLLNTFRFSYSRTTILFNTPEGPIGPQFSFVQGKDIGTINIGGVTSFGPDLVTPVALKQNLFTWSDDLFYSLGSHSLKFGALINRYQQYMQVSTFHRGLVVFPDLRSFLLAQPSVYQAVTPGSILNRTYHHSTVGMYIQDDWRLGSTLTLNLGLRYEFITQPQEVRGRGAALRDVQHDKDTTLGPPFENPSLKNFSPRFGFAWDVRGDGNTAVRGGFGLLYDVGNLASALIVGTTATPPFSRVSALAGPAAVAQFSIPFSFPATAAGRGLRTVDYLIQQPHLLQYNLTVERQLPFEMAVTFAYGGSRGINILQTVEGNPTIPLGIPEGRNRCLTGTPPPAFNPTAPKCWLPNAPRTNPNWVSMEYKTGGGNSWYNSFQFGLTKRLSKGLQFQSSYTWSKTIDETQSQLSAENNSSQSFASDPSNRQVDKAVASFDIAHNWRFNAIYRLPELSSAGPLGKVLNGWWLSGILSLQTGYPFSPSLQNNRSRSGVNAGQSGDRPDLVAGVKSASITEGVSRGCLGLAPGTPLGTPNQWFDPCAYTIPPEGFLGTAGRNTLRGPGFATLDFSLAKDTAMRYLGESGKLEFRVEFFNILNRANFITPGVGVAGGNNAAIAFPGRADVEPPLPTAGRILQTSSTSRQIQLALKLLF